MHNTFMEDVKRNYLVHLPFRLKQLSGRADLFGTLLGLVGSH